MTDTDEAILAMERRWWKLAGRKQAAISDELGLSAVRYKQLLNRLLDDPAAAASDPLLIHRLGRIHSSKADARAARDLD